MLTLEKCPGDFLLQDKLVLIVGARVDGFMAPPSPKSSYFIEFTPGRSTLNFFSIIFLLHQRIKIRLELRPKNPKINLPEQELSLQLENRLVLSLRTLFFGEEDGCSSGRKIQNFRGKEGRRENGGNFFRSSEI